MKILSHATVFIAGGLISVEANALSVTQAAPVRINKHVIPAVFVNALNQGMNVPVYIRFEGDASRKRSDQKIASAVVGIKDGAFLIKQINLEDLPQQTRLSQAVHAKLMEMKDVNFGDGTRLDVTKNAYLSLESKSFYIELNVTEEALAPAIIPRTNTLSNSSVKGMTNILNYSFGSYYISRQSQDSSSSYLTLDNTAAWHEHHINLNGSVYGIGTPNRNGELYRAMYEKDRDGHRLALGMVDTRNLQSIASMNAINTSRIYGTTFGNRSSTQIEDNTLSLIPVTVFLPAAGEVHIFRDGRLLSIQNFPMGSYEIDTSRLPFGVYNVDIQIVVNGRTVGSRSAQINKTFSRKSSVTRDFSWQVFGGALEMNRVDFQHNNSARKKDTWISGVAAATTQPWFSGVNLKSTIYGFDQNGVNETEANVIFSDALTTNQQVLIASDSTWRSISTLNLNLQQGYGTLWTTQEKSSVGNRLDMQKSDAVSFGATANLNKLSPWLGALTVSNTHDRYAGNRFTNMDYSQSLFSNRHASISLRSGIQNYTYNDRNATRDKYINVNVSIPLTTWFSAGISSENGNMLANTTIRKSLNDGAITQVGGSLSKRIKEKGTSGRDNGYSANSYLAFDTKYNTGNASLTHTSDHTSTFNMTTQGSIGWAKNNMAMGKGTQQSGIMIKTDLANDSAMMANINGRNYQLSGKRNYINLPPYAEYKVELMNDKNSEESVSVISGRQSHHVLYPGNISIIEPEVKQLVTIFGRIKSADGEALAGMVVKNHIGRAQTDEYGEFSMDIDKRHPVISILKKDNKVCETSLELNKVSGAIWLGDIKCQNS